MPYEGIEGAMSKREIIASELEQLPEQLLAYLQALKEAHAENAMPTLAAQSSLAKEWLTPEEDAAWARF